MLVPGILIVTGRNIRYDSRTLITLGKIFRYASVRSIIRHNVLSFHYNSHISIIYMTLFSFMIMISQGNAPVKMS